MTVHPAWTYVEARLGAAGPLMVSSKVTAIMLVFDSTDRLCLSRKHQVPHSD